MANIDIVDYKSGKILYECLTLDEVIEKICSLRWTFVEMSSHPDGLFFLVDRGPGWLYV